MNTVDDYIAGFSDDIQERLSAIRKTIAAAAPKATERIAWQMPTFWQGQNLIHFAAFKKHIGLYPGGEATAHFANRLTEYKTSKGTIQLPLSRPIDHRLITDIVRWRVSQAEGEK